MPRKQAGPGSRPVKGRSAVGGSPHSLAALTVPGAVMGMFKKSAEEAGRGGSRL